MSDASLPLLGIILFLLILISAFFSSSETAMMALNRYRLKHLSNSGHKGAQKAKGLLERPDRLIGLILIGNNFVNILASSIATVIALRLIGSGGVAVATGLLTLTILIFAEVTPKTYAAFKPEKIAFPSAMVLWLLLRCFYPLVWLINTVSYWLLRLLGININTEFEGKLSREELRTLVNEPGSLIPRRHRNMLVSILDLEEVTVDDIMVPRNEVFGINIDDDFDEIMQQISSCQHTRIPVFKGSMNQPIAILHMRKLARFLVSSGEKSKESLMRFSVEPYFVLEGTPLHTQLSNFQKVKRRLGLVVDEYGDVRGLVTLEDILEEIVGEFTTDLSDTSKDIHAQEDGSYIIDGATTVRGINRALKWNLPIHGPKTLSGLIVETLELIPENPVAMRLGDYFIEVIQVKDNMVKTARIRHKVR